MNANEIHSGARTVVQLAEYFPELKRYATELAAEIGAQTRGYFTPSEEDDVRALLVSYWQARNALFESITSLRSTREIQPGDRGRVFLVGFAGALLLVDAARFLRELAEHRPVVRRKLNEPAPQLGVPGGVYDAIQKSLVSARHGWHLYHAARFFHEQHKELQTLAGDPYYGQLLSLVEQLRHRLDVSLGAFAKNKLRTRADQVTRQISRSLFGRAMYGLQKLSGSLVADRYLRYGHRPQLPAEAAHSIRALLTPGDVLIVRKEHALTNYFLPGYWPHAALYLGNIGDLKGLGIQGHEHVKPRWQHLVDTSGNDSPCVLEAMKDGVRFRSLASPFASDSVVLLRPQLGNSSVATGLARCMAHEGKAYDFDFDFRRADRLVCTEVVYRAYDGVGPITIPLTRRAGRPTLSGNDLLNMGLHRHHFAPVAVFAPRFASGVVTGEHVTRILQEAAGIR